MTADPVYIQRDIWEFLGIFGQIQANSEGYLASKLSSLGPRRRRGVPGALFPPVLLPTTSLPRHRLNSPTWATLQHGDEKIFIDGKTSPKEGGLGGQSLPELGRGSLPEENQLSRQLSQLENWRAVAARVRHEGADSVEVDGPGSRATDTHGSMAPWYMEEQLPWLWLLGPGDRSKATSFS